VAEKSLCMNAMDGPVQEPELGDRLGAARRPCTRWLRHSDEHCASGWEAVFSCSPEDSAGNRSASREGYPLEPTETKCPRTHRRTASAGRA
jgi:hypothetical protein